MRLTLLAMMVALLIGVTSGRCGAPSPANALSRGPSTAPSDIRAEKLRLRSEIETLKADIRQPDGERRTPEQLREALSQLTVQLSTMAGDPDAADLLARLAREDPYFVRFNEQGEVTRVLLAVTVSRGDSDLRAIAKIPTLTTLRLLESPELRKYTSDGLKHIDPPQGVRAVDLTCSIGSNDTILDYISRFPILEQLDLTNVPVTDAGVVKLAGLTRLRALRLSGDAISDTSLNKLAGLHDLERLSVVDTSASDSTVAWIARLPRIRSLELYGTKVTDAGLAGLSSVATLEELDIRRTAVTHAVISELLRIHSLKRLWMDGQFTEAEMTRIHTALPGLTINDETLVIRSYARPD